MLNIIRKFRGKSIKEALRLKMGRGIYALIKANNLNVLEEQDVELFKDYNIDYYKFIKEKCDIRRRIHESQYESVSSSEGLKVNYNNRQSFNVIFGIRYGC